MGREMSATIRAVLDAQAAEVHDCLIITLPKMALDPEPISLYLGTAEMIANTVEFGEHEFQPHVRSIQSVGFSLGGSPDQASVSLQNLDLVYGLLMNQPQRTLDGASCIIYRGFDIGASDGVYETDEMTRGYIRDIKVDEDAVRFSVISEVSRKGAVVGGDPITQHCRFVFNEFGSGIGPECGWVPANGGDPAFCDHTPQGEKGCSSHGIRWRFGGVRQPEEGTIAVGPRTGVFGGTDDGFGGYGPGGYPHPGPRFDIDWLTRNRNHQSVL